MERLGYKRLGDFLKDYHNGDELNNALAYLHRDDEVQTNRLVYAIVQAFGGGKQQPPVDDEPVIDTTSPNFAMQFQGFTGTPGTTPARVR